MPNQFLVHPHNGGINFGQVPEMNSRGFLISEGEIRLVSGKHIGPNRGWGASHIWAEHSQEMAVKGFQTYQEVPAYVASIVSVGTRLFFSGDNLRNVRLMAVRSTSGTAILEFKDRREGPIWSVVTAFSGVRTHGTRVGTVR